MRICHGNTHVVCILGRVVSTKKACSSRVERTMTFEENVQVQSIASVHAATQLPQQRSRCSLAHRT
jgi:hypothetical protein